MNRFTWYELRTTAVDAALAFYAEVAGWEVEGTRFLRRGVPVAEVTDLPERARALGAPPHWLGHLGVGDVDACVQGLIALGAQPLGPTRDRDGLRSAPIRDPLGAVLAISAREAPPSVEAVGWHDLETTDRERAWEIYAPRFGWTATDAIELGPPIGAYQLFAWGGPSAGAMANTALQPHVHTHWLFYFLVDDLERAHAAVTARNGAIVAAARALPDGRRLTYCEDDRGAAFGLCQLP